MSVKVTIVCPACKTVEIPVDEDICDNCDRIKWAELDETEMMEEMEYKCDCFYCRERDEN